MSDAIDAHDEIAELQQEIKTLQERVDTLEQFVEADDTHEDESTFEVEILDEGTEEQTRTYPKQVIADACDDDGVDLQDARAALRNAGYDPDDEIEQLLRRGEIYQPFSDILRVV